MRVQLWLYATDACVGAASEEADVRTRARGDSRNAEIGQRIRAARLRLGWTQVDLAGLLGVSYQQVNKYEKGVNSASGLRLLELGDRLGLEWDGWLARTTLRTQDRCLAQGGWKQKLWPCSLRLKTALSK